MIWLSFFVFSMNIYIRYFDNEKVCLSTDELLDFVSNIDGITLDDRLRQDVLDYAAGKFSFAKRFRVSPRSYFILIKTTATNMQEFKEYSQRGNENKEQQEGEKEQLVQILNEKKSGWYNAYVLFKRVVPSESGKFQYIDTPFRAKLKAESIQDCYDRVMNHLRTRADVDPRSQLPSIKGRNFQAEFLGEEA